MITGAIKQLTIIGCLSLVASLLLSSPAYSTSSPDEDQYEVYSETHDEVFSVQWQPHGNSLLFMREGYIFTIQSDGSGLTQLTAKDEDDPIWSADGTKIAFSSSQSGGDFFWMTASGGAWTSLKYHQQNLHLADWSPNGQKIAFVTRRGGSGPYIALMTSAGAEQTFLTTGLDAAWHPSGQYMIVSDEGVDQHLHLYEINVSTRQRTQITSGNYDDTSPRYSPDGTVIVFDSTMRGYAAGSDSSICLIHRDGTGLTVVPVPHAPNWENSPAGFSPDGQHLVFAGGPYVPTDIYICRLDGTGLRHVTTFYAPIAKASPKPMGKAKLARGILPFGSKITPGKAGLSRP